ncbi:tigger transposable element-derived protein 3-like [Zootoca vivipara]|uniref:tigger transposable element-derived protein 3-like n=1 Tax=Zootoca vivipara TaxID=8524 RepID=UPI001590613B|nr:tigger transposable element-derived protein 3-like [Zootoca vivipara]
MAQKDQVPLDTDSGLDQHPKRVKEEEELEMYPKRPEVSPGKGGENGLSPPALGQNHLETGQPDSRAGSEEGLVMDRRVGCGPSAPAFGICRAPMGEMPHWCLECGKNFAQKAELEKHGLNHTRQCSYICGDCGRSLMEHVALATGQGACLAGNASNHTCYRKRVSPLSSETVVQRKERKELSLQEKVRVLEMLEGPKVSQSELAKRFGVSQPQICRIIKNKERILAEWCKNGNPGRKRKLEEKTVAGEVALLQWFEHRCVSSTPADGLHLQEKAGDLSKMFRRNSELEAGLGWLRGFKAKQKAAHGRPLEEKENSEELEDEGWESNVLPYILNKYDSRDIYACGEAGILFRATPEGLAWDGGEGAKDQLTVLLCTNLDASDKRDVLVVGKARRPFGFQGVGSEGLLPVTYRADSKAWMTATIFTEWLQKFNEDMKRTERSVVLFLVPCAVHPDTELSHTKMVFMPPGSSRVHPLEHGLVQNFKCHYRRRMLLRLLAVLDGRSAVPASELSKHLTLLDAVHMIVQAWLDVCPQTITSCFQAAGFGLALRIPAPPMDVVQALGFKDRQQFEQFVLVDEELECFGDQEGAEMLQGVQEPACATAEEEKADNLPCPSKADVMESLATLRRYFECHSVSSTAFQTFYKLEDVVHGMSLANMQVLRAKGLNKEGL